MTAPLADTHKPWLADALKEVEFLYSDITETVAARDAAIDGVSPMIRDEVELTSVDANTIA